MQLYNVFKCATLVMVIRFAPNKNIQKIEQHFWCGHKLF